MAGGRGWDNGGYLDSLGGDEEDRDTAKEQYEQYSQTRKAFEARQQAYLQTEAGRRAMQQQEALRNARDQADNNNDDDPAMFLYDGGIGGVGGELFDEMGYGAGGGSRFASMMRQAKRKQQQQSQMGGMFPPQKFAIPLDDETMTPPASVGPLSGEIDRDDKEKDDKEANEMNMGTRSEEDVGDHEEEDAD